MTDAAVHDSRKLNGLLHQGNTSHDVFGENRVRITGQLVDTTTGTHIWADRFDGAMEDIFDLQEKMSTIILGAIAPKLELAEIDRPRRKPTESLDVVVAWLLYGRSPIG